MKGTVIKTVCIALLTLLTFSAAFVGAAHAAENETPTENVIGVSLLDFNYTGSWSGEKPRTSAAGGDTAELSFRGTGIEINIGRGAGAGIAEFYIDEALIETVDMYNSTAATEKMFEKNDLENGNHTLKIVNTGRHNDAGNGKTNINLDSVNVIAVDYRQVKCSDEVIEYTGEWAKVGETMRSNSSDKSCKFKFEGNGLDIYFGVGPGAGIIEVHIDGKLAKTIDAYSATSGTVKLFSDLTLDTEEHTVELINTGRKNDSGTATNMNLAYFIVYNIASEEGPGDGGATGGDNPGGNPGDNRGDNPGGSQSPVTGDITAAVVLISSLSALALVAAFGVSKRKSVK